jgi:RecB family exonuclease
MKMQLHPSGLTMMANCGEQFRRRYIEGQRRPPRASLVVGTAVHAAVERSLAPVLTGDDLPPVEAVEAIAADALAAEWQREEVVLDDDETVEGARGSATDKAVRLARLHRLAVAPSIRPTALESRWVLDLDGYDFELAGTIDIVDQGLGGEIVRDTKTSGKRPAASTADESLQLTAYALARLHTGGALPESVALDYLVDSARGPFSETLASQRTEADFAPFLERVSEAVRAIEAGVFMPASPDSWVCSPRWCGYYDDCRYVRRPVSAPAPAIVREIAPASPAKPARNSLSKVFDAPAPKATKPACQPPPKLALW